MLFSRWTITLAVGIIINCANCVHGWTNEEFEMFDLVEELTPVTLYEFLGVSKDASVKEIKSAYRQLSVKLHPDKNPDDPNAHVKFRQLVGAYEALKDDELRKSYHNVLEFGLPSWRQPVFYFRRARRLAIWQVSVVLLLIVTVTQYLAAWGGYFERRLSLNEYLDSNLRRARKSRKANKEGPKIEEVKAELEEKMLQKPSIFNTAPFQLMRLGKYLVVQFPFDVVQAVQVAQQERKRAQERLIQEKLLEEERNIPPEPKKPRKRKTFQIPEKEFDDDDTGSTKSTSSDGSRLKQQKPQEEFVSGGLWTDDDITQLIKLCSKYPGGYPDRWNTISMIMRRPMGEITHMAKRVLEDLSKKQVEEEETSVAPVKVKVKTKGSKIEDENVLQKVMAWSKDEQKRLESALQMYPKSTLGDRWAKIASHVGKSKEECLQRYKYVADLVKKKKEQEQATEDPQTPSLPTNISINTQIVDDSQASGAECVTENNASRRTSSKDSLSRQNSSSSDVSGSGSDNEWCMVDDKRQ